MTNSEILYWLIVAKERKMETIVITSFEETVKYMLSEDFKDRLIAEYAQLEYRMSKIISLINSDNKYITSSQYEDLKKQLLFMSRYHDVLNKRLGKIYHINVQLLNLEER